MRPVTFPMKILLARLDYQAQRAAAFASLRSIVERGRNFHLLQRIWIRQRHRVEVSKVEIVHVDSLQRHTVVAGALSVHRDIRASAPSGTHVRWLASHAGRQIEQE